MQRTPRSRLRHTLDLTVGLRVLGREIAAWQRDRAAPVGLSGAQAEALLSIEQDGSTGMNQLAERLCIAPSTATRLVDQLERKGWVQRTADPEDRRRSVLQLTAQGEEMCEELQGEFTQDIFERLRRLDDPTSCTRALEQLTEMLQRRG